MKILVISHMYPSFRDKTYGIFVHKQVKALQEQGHEIKVVSPVPYAPFPLTLLKKKWQAYASIPANDLVEGIEVYYPRYIEFPRSYLLEYSGYLMYLGIKKIIKQIQQEFQFGLIHAHVAVPDGHAAYFLKKSYNLPSIVTIHGQDFQHTIYRNEKCKNTLFQVLRYMEGIITVSNKLKNVVEQEDFSNKITVINNGIDLGDCVLDIPNNTKLSGNIKILSVSNLKKTKGIDLNIRAIASLVTRYPDLRYYIVGDGEERKNLEDLARELGLGDKVVFLGHLDHVQTMEIMAAADIFCLPSWQEGFGVVYLEAMAQGKPVIAVKGEGIEDVMIDRRNGILVNPQSVEDIIQALTFLLDNPQEAENIATAGKSTVLSHYIWEENAKQTSEIYQKVTAG